MAWAVDIAHQPGSYSTLDQIRGQVDITNALAHERARGERANARRVAGQRRAKERDYDKIRTFLGTFYETDESAALPFDDLLCAVNRALVYDESEPVTPQRLGKLLREDGIKSERGVVTGLKERLCDDPDTCEYTSRYRRCPVSPCPLRFQGGV